MSRCTIWPPKAKQWFDRKFGDLCDAHDKDYVLRYKSKWDADIALTKGIWERGYPALAVGTWFFCQTVGWWYWVRD